jgi:kinesin family protein 6/9
VFERVGRRAVQGALDGINGTIFAYGQTGSGKTFTITGGAGAYADRGIIPRAIAHLFSEAASRKDSMAVNVRVSYLEIYNEQGYDLLGEKIEAPTGGEDIGRSRAGGYDELPRVTLYDDDAGNLVMRGLAAHPAESAEEALNLLFRGDTARAVAATTSNAASSRSHCVFTLSVETRPVGGGGGGEGGAGGAPGSEMVRRSKLNLVDLAGSERIGKTGIDGHLLAEAKARANACVHARLRANALSRILSFLSLFSDTSHSALSSPRSTSTCRCPSWSRSSSLCRSAAWG